MFRLIIIHRCRKPLWYCCTFWVRNCSRSTLCCRVGYGERLHHRSLRMSAAMSLQSIHHQCFHSQVSLRLYGRAVWEIGNYLSCSGQVSPLYRYIVYLSSNTLDIVCWFFFICVQCSVPGPVLDYLCISLFAIFLKELKYLICPFFIVETVLQKKFTTTFKHYTL